MTQQNQNSTSKQNQDKPQHAHAANDQMEKELKQNEIDKQHNQEHQEVLNTADSNPKCDTFVVS
ncbi:hypothetical protein [Acinetobacter thermotolerans]|uniref:hypothetical protein n=1 Tax=Acinetobacter thermotolerans TaxID=3151487 RepID=UPI00325B595D